MTQLIFRTFSLVEPTRNQKNNCEICETQFGILTREHLCKRCFRFICDQCSPHKVKIYKADLQHRMHRMCKFCFTENQILTKYIESNKLVWGQDSDMSRIWQKQLALRQNNNRASLTQTSKINNKYKSKKIRYTTTPTELWSSFNYSFRQFIGMAIDKNKQLQQSVQPVNKKQKSLKIHSKIVEQLLEDLSDVLIMLNNPNIEVESIFYILIFFMAHASSMNAKLFTKSLVQLLSFEQARIDNLAYYLQKLKCTQNQIDKMMTYFQIHAPLIISSASCNYFSAEISIGVISIMFSKKNYDQLQKIIAYIVSKKKQFVIKNANTPQLIQIQLLRNNQGLDDGFKKFSKKCESQGNQTELNSKQNKNNQQSEYRSQSDILSLRQKKYFQKLVKQNEQLKIKNKNQQEQIVRLKSQNNRLIEREQRMKNDFQNKDTWTKVRKKSQMISKMEKQKQQHDGQLFKINEKQGIQLQEKQSQKSYQSYWQQVQLDQNSDSNFENQKQQVSSLNKESNKKLKQKKLVKKYRLKQDQLQRKKRMTTMSQKLAKQIDDFNKSNANEQNQQQNSFNYEQIIYEKNERILKLNKKLEQLKKQQHINSQDSTKNGNSKNTSKLQIQQMERLKQELKKVKNMNQKLIQKLKQFSNLLMDKQQQQVTTNSQQFMKLYEQNHHGECVIF